MAALCRFPGLSPLLGQAQVPGNLLIQGLVVVVEVVGARQGHRRHVRLLQARTEFDRGVVLRPLHAEQRQSLDPCHLRQGGIAAPLSCTTMSLTWISKSDAVEGRASRPRQAVAIGWRQTIDDEGHYLGTKGETHQQPALAPQRDWYSVRMRTRSAVACSGVFFFQ